VCEGGYTSRGAGVVSVHVWLCGFAMGVLCVKALIPIGVGMDDHLRFGMNRPDRNCIWLLALVNGSSIVHALTKTWRMLFPVRP